MKAKKPRIGLRNGKLVYLKSGRPFLTPLQRIAAAERRTATARSAASDAHVREPHNKKIL